MCIGGSLTDLGVFAWTLRVFRRALPQKAMRKRERLGWCRAELNLLVNNEVKPLCGIFYVGGLPY